MKAFVRKPIEGLFPLMPLCLKDNQDIDYDGIRRNVDLLESKGIPGFIQFGCMGQMNAPSEEEFNKVCDVCVDACKGKQIACVVASTSTNTKEAIRRATYAEDAGADGTMLMAPYAFPVKSEWAVDFYSEVDDALRGDMTMILYNIPSMNGVNVTSSMWRDRLLGLKSIRAVKDSNMAIPHHDESILAVAETINWFSCTDANFWVDSQLGARGIVGIMSWVALRAMRKWYDDCLAGKQQDEWVRKLYKALVEAWGAIRHDVVHPDFYMAYEHGRLNLFAEIGGGVGGHPRRPYERYSPDVEKEIRKLVRPLVMMEEEMDS